MHRRARNLDAVPAELRTFDARDWPGDLADAFELWIAARKVWAERHGWPGGPLARIAGGDDVRAVLQRRPVQSWGRTLDQLDAEAARLASVYGHRPKVRGKPV